MDEKIMHIRICRGDILHDESSVEDTSRRSENDTYSHKNLSTGSELSELGITVAKSSKALIVIVTPSRVRKSLITRQMTWR